MRQLGLFLLVLCCCKGDATGVLVAVYAEPGVVTRAGAIDIRVWGAPEGVDLFGVGRLLEDDGELDALDRATAWPFQFGMEPRGNNTDRRWGFEIRIYESVDSPTPFLVRRAQGVFFPGEIRLVRIVLRDVCIDVDCGANPGSTCIARGECEDTPVVDSDPWDGEDPRDDGNVIDGSIDGARDGSTDGGIDAPHDAGVDAFMGECLPGVDACDDEDPCTMDSCEEGSLTCRHEARPNDSSCGDSNLCCSGSCVDSATDPLNCGGCGTTCGANATCVSGECRCDDGFDDCDSAPGCEADLNRDSSHCMRCDNACMAPTPTCLAGTCSACTDAGDCAAPLSCQTAPTCESGLCVYGVQSGRCYIDGVCRDDDDGNPTNACEVCNPSISPTTWSADLGQPCDTLYCRVNQTCRVDGSCGGGTDRNCSDPLTCTADVCNEPGRTCDNPISTGCLVAGTCYANGFNDDDCRVCNQSLSQTMFSTAIDGTTCADGTCRSGVCCACFIDGICRTEGELDVAGCRECRSASSSTSWTNLSEGASCGGVCNGGGSCCVACSIGGVCRAQDALNPANQCEECDAARSRTTWSDRNGEACIGGTCMGNVCPHDAGPALDGPVFVDATEPA